MQFVIPDCTPRLALHRDPILNLTKSYKAIELPDINCSQPGRQKDENKAIELQLQRPLIASTHTLMLIIMMHIYVCFTYTCSCGEK